MATIINYPPQHTGGINGVLMAIVMFIIVVGVVAFFYGIPSLQKNEERTVLKAIPDTSTVDANTPQ
jgi:hypothetical protein